MCRFLKSVLIFSLIFNVYNFAQSNAEIWKFKTNGIIYSSPLIHDNVLYIGSLDSNFYAIDAKTGTEKWHFKASNKIFSTAAIYNNIVFFESGNKLFALNLQGNLLWSKVLCPTVTNQFDSWDYFHSSPNVVNGNVYICTEKGLAYGFKADTGDTVFYCKTNHPATGIRTKPVINNNKIYFGDMNGFMYAYDLISRQKVWDYNTTPEKLWTGGEPAICTDHVVYNNTVYFAGKSSIVFAVDAETGERKWKYLSPTKQWLVGGPVVEDTLLFIGSSDQHLFSAINSVTGTLLWKVTLEGRIFCTPLIDGNYVYVCTGIESNNKIGSLTVLNKLTGEVFSRFVINSQTHSSPVISDGMIYFGSADGYVRAIDKQKLLTTLYPKTDFKQQGNISLGNLDKDTTITECIENKGDGQDEVTINLIKVSALNGVVTSDLNKFTIAPHDSQKVAITISASKIPPKADGYTVYFEVKSAYNLDLNRNAFRKAILFNVVSPTAVQTEGKSFPGNYLLYQNYPNPFNPKTLVKYGLPVESRVLIRVFNLMGEIVRELKNTVEKAGYHQVSFDGENLSSGIYFYTMYAAATDGSASFKESMKLLLLK